MLGEIDTYPHIISISPFLFDFAQDLPPYFYLSASHKSLNLRTRKAELKREILIGPELGILQHTLMSFYIHPEKVEIFILIQI